MARFFVGQRVKLVRPTQQGNHGKTGRIIEIFPEKEIFLSLVDCDVEWDQALTPYTATLTHTSRLEPLTDSNDLVSWESMRELWMPEHLREKV